jgi:hypothetical protein
MRFARPSAIPETRPRASASRVCALTLNPNTLGNWPVSTVSAIPLR